MIALFSAVLGFISSAAPEFIKLFTERADRAHEITLLTMQMEYEEKKLAAQGEAATADRSLRLQEIEIAAAANEQLALNARPGSTGHVSGIRWVDALSGSVRPVLTYAFFVLYFTVKYCQFVLLTSPHLPWIVPLNGAQAIVSLWTEEDVAIFSAVIGFWFGNRTMLKARRGVL